MSHRKLIRSMRKADEAGVDLSKIPFVVGPAQLRGKFAKPLTRVGPVQSGELREVIDDKQGK